MKKILFLLLLSVSMYGQVPADATPLENIQITNNVEDNASTKVTVQNANGVQNWKFATSLPISTAVANALDLKVENSAGAIQGFAITDNGNGTVNIATGTAYLRTTNDPYAPLIKYVIPAVTNLALMDNANNFVLVDYNGGSPALTVTIAPGTINTTTNSIAYLISRVGTTLDYINLVGQNVDANGKLRRRFLNSEGLKRSSGAVLSGLNRNLILTAGLYYSGLIEVPTPAFNTSTGSTFTQAYLNGSTWVRTTGNTQINNTQYSLAGVLTTMPSNDYRVDYVYTLADNPSKLYVLLGTTTYNNITNARLAPVPVDLPTELQYLGARVGRVIIQKDATTTETTSEFATIYQAGTAQLHNDLGGLNLGNFQHLTVAEKANIVTKNGVETITGSKTFTPTVSAVTNLARGAFINPTLTATANNDVLVGLDIAPTFSNGGFTGVNQVDLRIPRTLASSSSVFEIKRANTALILYADVGETTFYHSLTSGSLRFNLGFASMMRVLPNSGNILIQNGGTFTDAGFRLDVNGTTRLQNTLTLGTSPTTSAGTYDFLTRNTSTGVVERVLSNSIAPIDSPTFTGVPTAPTATTGTNTTQIATTAFVNSASNWTKTLDNITNNNVGNVYIGATPTEANFARLGVKGIGTDNIQTWVNSSGTRVMTVSNIGSITATNGDSSFGSVSLTGFLGLSPNNGINGNALGTTSIISRNTFWNASRIDYTTDYSASYTSRSLTDKAYVDTKSPLSNPSFTGTVTTNGSFVNSSAPATNALLANGTTLANPISGTGTTNFLPKFTSSGVIGNSIVTDNGTSLGVGTSSPSTGNLVISPVIANGTMDGLSIVFHPDGVLSRERVKLWINDFNGQLDLKDSGENKKVQISALGDSYINGGNLGIGTASPSAKLDVNGSASISSLAGTGTRTVVASSTGQLSAVSNIDYRNYKVYTALLTQSGTNAPVATVLENTLGGSVVWTRSGTGSYAGTLTGVFTDLKTWTTIGGNYNSPSSFLRLKRNTLNDVSLVTESGGISDNVLENTSIEIRVYN